MCQDEESMSVSLDELCPALKKANVATSMNTISVRRWYRKNAHKVRVKKLLQEIASRGRCVSANTVDRLGVTRCEIVKAWLKFREQQVPIGKKQLKMQHLVASWI